MNGVNGDLAKPYVNVDRDNEHIDSYYSRIVRQMNRPIPCSMKKSKHRSV